MSNRSNPQAEGAAEDYQASYAAALRFLARREHSELELRHKLAGKRFPAALIDAVLAQLLKEGLLSDRRFAEVYVRGRFERGYGPLRIQAELRERGIAGSLTADALEPLSPFWVESAIRQRSKRFGEQRPDDYRERARQMRFLQQRGFTGDHIQAALASSAA